MIQAINNVERIVIRYLMLQNLMHLDAIVRQDLNGSLQILSVLGIARQEQILQGLAMRMVLAIVIRDLSGITSKTNAPKTAVAHR